MRKNKRFRQIMLCTTGWCLLLAIQADASDPTYDQTYSRAFKERTGYELSEEGVRAALDNFDNLQLSISEAVLAVVGEQKYVSLTNRLKVIYAYGPEDAPSEEFAWRYEHKLFRDYFKMHIIRSLILLGDEEVEELATQFALESPGMEVVTGAHAIRNLKYLVKETDKDVLDTLRFLVETQQGSANGGYVAAVAAHELVEIEQYLYATGCPKFDQYSQTIDEIFENSNDRVRNEIESRRNIKPTWNVTRKILGERGDMSLLNEGLKYMENRK